MLEKKAKDTYIFLFSFILKGIFDFSQCQMTSQSQHMLMYLNFDGVYLLVKIFPDVKGFLANFKHWDLFG